MNSQRSYIINFQGNRQRIFPKQLLDKFLKALLKEFPDKKCRRTSQKMTEKLPGKFSKELPKKELQHIFLLTVLEKQLSITVAKNRQCFFRFALSAYFLKLNVTNMCEIANFVSTIGNLRENTMKFATYLKTS